MACCACCCGGEDCTEGQEGKCCCGGSTGTCCQEGEYCCDGVCEDEPCGTPCTGDADCTSLEVGYTVVSCACDPAEPVDTFPIWFASLAEALAYEPPAGCGACTADPADGKCCDGACYPSVLPGYYGEDPDTLSCP